MLGKAFGQWNHIIFAQQKGSEESKLRVTFRRLDDYIFFVNQLITIGNEAKLKLDKDGQEKTLLELEKVLEKK